VRPLITACSIHLSLHLMIAVAATGQSPCAGSRNNIPFVAYLMSAPQDHRECSMRVEGGVIRFDAAITNPALSCPDAFAWKLLASAIQQEFWKGWAADEYTWPNVQPLPLCKAGDDPRKCCAPGRTDNPGYDDAQNPAKNCPWFPGDHLAARPTPPLRVAAQPGKAHLPTFALHPDVRKRQQDPPVEPGRLLRQSMAELVFRNKPMFEYTFRNNLYNQEGVAAVFKRNAANLEGNAPYRLDNGDGAFAEIDYPTGAVMIKSNWINGKRAAEVGLIDDPANPHIRMTILSPVTDNNGTILEAGEHWLIALHISSKDAPNWIWATFEHVNNPGRCDYTGCNDSFGYSSPDPVGPGQASNFTMPSTRCDDLLLPNWVFDHGKVYAGGSISPQLRGVLQALEIGGKERRGESPSAADRAWRSYRLKGTQSAFTDSMGRPTRLGNSVTEGGFVTSSSCITCHARASTNAAGTIPLPLGVFVNETSDTGYLQSAKGIPIPDWFHQSAQPPSLQALQTDFVWGFLAALCINPTCDSVCPNKPASCTASPAKSPPPRSIRHKVRNH